MRAILFTLFILFSLSLYSQVTYTIDSVYCYTNKDFCIMDVDPFEVTVDTNQIVFATGYKNNFISNGFTKYRCKSNDPYNLTLSCGCNKFIFLKEYILHVICNHKRHYIYHIKQ